MTTDKSASDNLCPDGHYPVMVTTKHRGVFFGYAPNGHEAMRTGIITLKRCRNCVQWRRLKGFLALAVSGPSDHCRVGPAACEAELEGVTACVKVLPEAAQRWEEAPWRD